MAPFEIYRIRLTVEGYGILLTVEVYGKRLYPLRLIRLISVEAQPILDMYM